MKNKRLKTLYILTGFIFVVLSYVVSGYKAALILLLFVIVSLYILLYVVKKIVYMAKYNFSIITGGNRTPVSNRLSNRLLDDVADMFSRLIEEAIDTIRQKQSSIDSDIEMLKNESEKLDTIKQNILQIYELVKDVLSELSVNNDLIRESSMLTESIIDIVIRFVDNNKKQKQYTDNITLKLKELVESMAVTIESSERVLDIANQILTFSTDSTINMNLAKEHVDKIYNVSSRISEITDVINDIAEKIHVISINAAIESSHAGKYGKGFGVLTKSIREFAMKTKEHAFAISQIIETATNEIIGVTDIIQIGVDTFNSIQTRLIEITTLMNEITMTHVNYKGIIEETNKMIDGVKEISTIIEDEIQQIASNSGNVIQNIAKLIQSHTDSINKIESELEKILSLSYLIMEQKNKIEQITSSIYETRI